MSVWFFTSDLHGHLNRYEALFRAVREERPHAVLLGGDLLPPAMASHQALGPARQDFVRDYLAEELANLSSALEHDFPRILVILGNDDPRHEEAAILELAARGLCHYLHGRTIELEGHDVFGYACVPPTPYLLKDWERYDVSRYVDPGCVSPEEGLRSVPLASSAIRFGTIRKDLERLGGHAAMERAIFMFHAPPYKTNLDRADLDGQMVDSAPLDVHVGSIAIQQFITTHQPLITLHGHVHESSRITGTWRDRIGRTHLFSAAHDGPELALVRFDPGQPEHATRELIG